MDCLFAPDWQIFKGIHIHASILWILVEKKLLWRWKVNTNTRSKLPRLDGCFAKSGNVEFNPGEGRDPGDS